MDKMVVQSILLILISRSERTSYYSLSQVMERLGISGIRSVLDEIEKEGYVIKEGGGKGFSNYEITSEGKSKVLLVDRDELLKDYKRIYNMKDSDLLNKLIS